MNEKEKSTPPPHTKPCSGDNEMSLLSREEVLEWVERRGGGGGGTSVVAMGAVVVARDVWNVSLFDSLPS